MLSRESWEGDFSGWRMPGRMKARWRWEDEWEVEEKRVRHCEAALAIEVSSSCS